MQLTVFLTVPKEVARALQTQEILIVCVLPNCRLVIMRASVVGIAASEASINRHLFEYIVCRLTFIRVPGAINAAVRRSS